MQILPYFADHSSLKTGHAFLHLGVLLNTQAELLFGFPAILLQCLQELAYQFHFDWQYILLFPRSSTARSMSASSSSSVTRSSAVLARSNAASSSVAAWFVLLAVLKQLTNWRRRRKQTVLAISIYQAGRRTPC